MSASNRTEDKYQERSSFVRRLVQHSNVPVVAPQIFARAIQKKIVQFWHNLEQLPSDVNDCIETWKKIESLGFERLLFDSRLAADFIYQKLGLRYRQAYDRCYHPAMQSDFFRLCYIYSEGGCYIDTDDVYSEFDIQYLFSDERLKIQPLCYDTGTHSMVPPVIFTKPGAYSENWIFYFNNNPLIAGKGHPVIERSLNQATIFLEKDMTNGLPEIQSTTGPGNLTKSIFDTAAENGGIEQTLMVVLNWEDIAKSRWELSYRNDARNWRLSNSVGYNE